MTNKQLLETLYKTHHFMDVYKKWNGDKRKFLQYCIHYFQSNSNALGSHNITDDLCYTFSKIAPKLETLHCYDSHITDKGCEFLSQLQYLSELRIEKGFLSTDALTYLQKSSSLQYLVIIGNRLPIKLTHLPKLTSLKFLTLDDNQITDDGCRYFARMKNLRRISLAENLITDNGCVMISKMDNVEELVLNNNNITNDGLVHISKMKKLKKLWIKGTQITDGGITTINRCRPSFVIYGK